MSEPEREGAGSRSAALERWLSECCGVRPPLRFEPVVGGRSNLTSIVTDADGRRVVVRRPPSTGVLASAHDVVREGRIMAALAGTDVPVPRVLAVAAGSDALGPAVLVTAHVPGMVVRDRSAAAALAPTIRARLTSEVAGVLAGLHRIEVDDVGLGDLAPREGYFSRQVARWTRQVERGGDRPLPVLAELARRLADAAPQQDRVALVHGDYRLDNLIVGAESGEIVAVLDWELATLGDPLADVGTLLAYWGVPARQGRPARVLHPRLPTAVEGFAQPQDLVAAYAGASGIAADVLSERLRPYLAFAWFRIACILEGVRIRTAAGAYGTPGEDGEEEQTLLAGLVPELGERALGVLDRAGPVGWDHELT